MSLVSFRATLVIIVLTSLWLAAGCGSDPGTPDGAPADGGPDGVIDGPPADGQVDGRPDGDGPRDGGPDQGDMKPDLPPKSKVVVCPGTPPEPPAEGACTHVPGDASLVVRGTLLAPGQVLENGELLIDADGMIQCVDCDCSQHPLYASASRLECKNGVVSPGLINAHDHLNWATAAPAGHTDRYDHRHDWRRGLRGHRALSYASGDSSQEAKLWGEMRFAMGGATSLIGSTSADRFIRNLDDGADQEGLGKPEVQYETFPLGDTNGTLLASGCDYPGFNGPNPSGGHFFPHVSEGIDPEARNEFLCLTTTEIPGGRDVANRMSAFIHAIGLQANDAALLAARGTSVIWSPRSNVDLYGNTAAVPMYHRLGVNVALGTDWIPSGSMTMLRELQCAARLNRVNFGVMEKGERRPYFTDEQLVRMATVNAARAAGMDDVIGSLRPGLWADIAIWDGSKRRHYTAIVEAHQRDVALVLRGGRPLYGDAPIIEALAGGDGVCERIDEPAPEDCLNGKRLCAQREMGMSYAALRAKFTAYRLFYCGEPMREPSCVPTRNNESDDGIVYTGEPSDGDMDGDGVPDEQDNCPAMFNPPRPVDRSGTGLVQADFDGDGVGDACDPCPLDADTTECSTPDPNDRDGDGVPNDEDNCPDASNPGQEDGDGDERGDACDACPEDPNPGTQGCPTTIYAIKRGEVAIGSQVRLTDVLVTAVGPRGFYAAHVPETAGYAGVDYSAVFVFTSSAPTVTPGTRISFDGRLSDFRGQRQLTMVSGLVQGETAPVPAPVVIADVSQVAPGGARAAALEGVLVRVGPVQVASVDTSGGRFVIDGPLTVGNQLFQLDPLPAVGEVLASVTGHLRAFDNTFEVEPRQPGDLVAGPPRLVSITPDRAFLPDGDTLDLTVSLDRPAEGNTVVSLSATGSLALEDAGGSAITSVTIANGATSAGFRVRATLPGGAVPGAEETVTATLNAVSVRSRIRTVADGEVPVVSDLSSPQPSVAINATVQLTVRLSIPAPAGGVQVTLSATGAGSVPAQVPVAAGQTEATFTFTAGAHAGSATVRASLNGGQDEVTLEVVERLGHLVINEVDYDTSNQESDAMGADTLEFIELFNAGGTAVNLTGLAVVLVNGNDSEEYRRIDLATATPPSGAPAGVLPPGAFLVIATQAVSVDPDAYVIRFAAARDNVQNGDPDGIAILDTTENTVVDALSYEGELRDAMIDGISGAIDLVEGAPFTGADSNSAVRSLVRFPDGNDTDDAASDWALTSMPTPGAPNVVMP